MFLKNTSSLSSLGWNFCSERLFTECWENMERNLIIVVETQCHLSSRSNVIVVRSNKAASRVAPGHNGGHQTSRNWNSSSPFVTRNLSSLGQALKMTILWACKRPRNLAIIFFIKVAQYGATVHLISPSKTDKRFCNIRT